MNKTKNKFTFLFDQNQLKDYVERETNKKDKKKYLNIGMSMLQEEHPKKERKSTTLLLSGVERVLVCERRLEMS